MKSMKSILCALACLLMILGAAGCEQKKEDGPAAEAGKKIDEMIQGKGPMEKAGEKVDQFMDDAGKALDDAGDKLKKDSE